MMDGIGYNPSVETSSSNESQDDITTHVMSIEQIQRLVRLLDRSDVSELELKRAAEGTHLVLRKAKTPDINDYPVEHQYVPAPVNVPISEMPEKTSHKVLAHLVGTFHTWAKPKGEH